MKKHNRYILYIIPVIVIVIVMICLYYFYAQIPPKTENPHKIAHLSIDDVIDSLNDLTDNQHRYDSVFSQSFFNYLRALYKNHGAKFSLFVFEKRGRFHIDRVPIKYQKEFEQNSSWLRFGFHGSDPAKDADLHELKHSFDNTHNAIIRFSGKKSLCNVLRLHHYRGDEEFINFLVAQGGIKGFLCADDNRISYHLTPAETLVLNEKSILIKNQIKYFRTDLRLENMSFADYNLLKIQNNDRIIIFTHELALNRLNRYKLERCIQWLSERGYVFSFLD